MPKAQSRREKEIYKLVKERRVLCRAWRKMGTHEKEPLKALWSDIKSYLTSLRRAEHIRKRKESQRSKFLKDPSKMARSLLE